MNNERTREAATEANRFETRIEVAETLRGAHDLVRTANQEFAGAKSDASGILEAPPQASLDISVSKNQLRRSLLLMDALLKAMRDQDYPIEAGPIVVIFEEFEEKVAFGIKETLETVREQPDEHDLAGYYEFGHSRFHSRRVPSGRLVLFIPDAECYWAAGCRARWSDARKQRLENCLNKFVGGLIEVAARKKEHRLAEERRLAAEAEAAAQREAEARRRAEKRKLQAEEQARLDLLLRQVEAWRRSEDIRGLVEAVKAARSAQGEEVTAGGELDQWAAWAISHADRFDPTKEAPPSILDEQIPEEPRRW